MKVITDRQIITDNTSNADGKLKSFFEKRKEGKEERKEKREERKEERKSNGGFFSEKNREIRKKRRKARRSARKLRLDKDRDGRITYKDFIPKLRKTKNSNTGLLDVTKKNPDGSIETVKEKDIITTSNGDMYDKNDVEGKNIKKDSNGQDYVELNEDEVEEVTFADGSNGYAKKKDVEGMSKGLKIGLIAGGVLVLGTIIYLVVRKK